MHKYLLMCYYIKKFHIKYKNNVISKNELKDLIYKKEYIRKYYFSSV